MRTHPVQPLALAVLAAGLAGCSDSEDLGQVRLQVASHLAAAVEPGTPGQLVITAGGDEIVLESVGLVLRKVRLDGGAAAPCPEDAEGGSSCGELRFGPVLLELPMDEGAETVLDVDLPVGSYTGLQFQLHRPTDANDDADFVADHPEYEGTSIRVAGSYNGTPFTFTSDLTLVESVVFPALVEVDADEELALTLLVSVGDWFAADGGGLVDPAQASNGGPLESTVEQRIRASFRAFRDGDADAEGD
jgi:hypothetical protein